MEPAEDIPRIKRQRTTKEEEDLNCPENLEKNTDVMFPSYDDRTGRTEGTEEDEEDEEESEESYDSRVISRRSSQQELGNSDDSQYSYNVSVVYSVNAVTVLVLYTVLVLLQC